MLQRYLQQHHGAASNAASRRVGQQQQHPVAAAIFIIVFVDGSVSIPIAITVTVAVPGAFAVHTRLLRRRSRLAPVTCHPHDLSYGDTDNVTRDAHVAALTCIKCQQRIRRGEYGDAPVRAPWVGSRSRPSTVCRPANDKRRCYLWRPC